MIHKRPNPYPPNPDLSVAIAWTLVAWSVYLVAILVGGALGWR